MIPADRQLANWRSQLDMIKGDDFFWGTAKRRPNTEFSNFLVIEVVQDF